MADEVILVEADGSWPAAFEAERSGLLAALGAEAVRTVEHFGSTAVAGLPAKPIIDILVLVDDLGAAREAFPSRLKPLGYVFWSDNPKLDRLYFVKGLPPAGTGRTHHLHVSGPDGPMREQLLFRDYLRAHPKACAAYAALKRDLAARFRTDRDAYTDGKSTFIADIMARARAWRAATP
jgi:GrpB-like predicted nucleotidyltransferase (UPF0157 family)